MNAQQTAGAPDGPGPCAFHVAADVLNVRSGPSEREPKVGALQHGEQVEALPTVVDGFRDLGGGRWAAQEFLLPAPGSACAP
nr:SH3 domain-containing protein [Saccharopolyspora hordei]